MTETQYSSEPITTTDEHEIEHIPTTYKCGHAGCVNVWGTGERLARKIAAQAWDIDCPACNAKTARKAAEETARRMHRRGYYTTITTE